LKRDPSRPLLFQVNFRAATRGFPAPELNGVVAGPAEYVDTGTSKFDLALEIETTAGKACYFEYRTDLFREQTIAQMEEDFKSLLRALISRPDARLSEVPEVAQAGALMRTDRAMSRSA